MALVLQIRNMVAVQEVISSLEKYPITKEALEVSVPGLSTRAGSEGGAWAAPTLGFPDFLEPQRLCSLAQQGLKGKSEGGNALLACTVPVHSTQALQEIRGFSSELRPLSLQEALHTLQCAAGLPVSDVGSRSRVLLPLPQCTLT